MAKDRERANGYVFFVELNLTAKESARRCNVTEKTFGDWVKKYGWKELRDSRNASPAKRLANVKEIISNLSDERLDLDREAKELEKNKADPKTIAEIRARIKNIDDGVSKWNKTLENIEKESRVPLSTYLIVMEEIFQAILKYDQEIYMRLVDFQEQHLTHISKRM